MITFTITFHGPFTIATGNADAGMDVSVDRANPLPASSLKGVMRGRAEHFLGLSQDVIDEIFGAPQRAGLWAWNDAQTIDGGWHIDRHARIKVDSDGSTDPGSLRLGEHVWARQATFTVEHLTSLGNGKQVLPEVDQELVLRASARAVTSLGGGRRRGEGWVTITDSSAWTEDESQRLLEIVASGHRRNTQDDDGARPVTEGVVA